MQTKFRDQMIVEELRWKEIGVQGSVIFHATDQYGITNPRNLIGDTENNNHGSQFFSRNFDKNFGKQVMRGAIPCPVLWD
jgi:helix-turn-helix protein